jgi:hypothetical protein
MTCFKQDDNFRISFILHFSNSGTVTLKITLNKFLVVFSKKTEFEIF